MNVIPMPTPQSLEVEQALLGSILLRPEQLVDLADILSPKAFYRSAHALIFRAILNVRESGQPVDLVTVTQELMARGELEKAGGAVFLAELSEHVGVASNAPAYAKAILDAYYTRCLTGELQEILKDVDRGGKFTDFLDLVDSRLETIRKAQEKLREDLTVTVNANSYLQTTTPADEDLISGGILQKGNALLLCGQPGIGKSVISLELAICMSCGLPLWGLNVPQPINVLFLQAENSEKTLVHRLKNLAEGLRVKDLSQIEFLPLHRRFNLMEKSDRQIITQTIKRCASDLVILDPLAKFHMENENDNTRMNAVLDNLTYISKETSVSWVIIHHHGKPNEGYSTYRGASSILGWADTLVDLVAKKDPHNSDRVLIQLNFNKIRNGPKHDAIILERRQDFVHFVSVESSIAPPSVVIKAMRKLGGKAVGQARLSDEIRSMTGCSRAYSYEVIAAAIGKSIGQHGKGRQAIFYEL